MLNEATEASRVPAQDYDNQLQRALNYEDYSLANDIRQRRQSVDEAMDKLKV